MKMVNNRTDQWLIDQYNRNRPYKDHISNVADISNSLLKDKSLNDKDYWFHKNDRKQRGG